MSAVQSGFVLITHAPARSSRLQTFLFEHVLIIRFCMNETINLTIQYSSSEKRVSITIFELCINYILDVL